MCRLLEEEKKKADSKVAQFKEWRRYFDFEQKGQKFYIKEFYKTTLPPKEDNRVKGNNSVYLPHLEIILLHYLSEEAKNGLSDVEWTNQHILTITGMCNDRYIHFKKNKRNIKILGTTKNARDNINDFYKRAEEKFKRMIETVLNNLKKRKFILSWEIIQKEHQSKWDKCYATNIISFDKDCIKHQQEKEVIEKEKKLLNNKIIDALDKQAEDNYKKNQKKTG
jgi:ssRNA-specific RNase YbeY (16S rRNA maturation enzyme)